jgi:O-antigen ligase
LLVFVVTVLVVLPGRPWTKAVVAFGLIGVAIAVILSPLSDAVFSPALAKFAESDADLLRTLTGARTEAWSASYELILIAPAGGLGFGAGDQLFSLTGLDRTFLYYQGATSSSAYLTVWVEVGLVGLLLFAAMLIAAFRDALGAVALRPLVGVAAALFGIGLVESFLTSPGSPFAILAFLSLGLAAAPTLSEID